MLIVYCCIAIWKPLGVKYSYNRLNLPYSTQGGMCQLIRDYTCAQFRGELTGQRDPCKRDILTKKDMESFRRWRDHRLWHSSAHRPQETERDGGRQEDKAQRCNMRQTANALLD